MVEFDFTRVKVDHVFTHLITLKPDPKKNVDIHKFVDYMRDRGYRMVLVDVRSDKDYKHYHGVFTYPKRDDYKTLKASLRKYINSNIGFARIDICPDADRLSRFSTYVAQHSIIQVLATPHL